MSKDDRVVYAQEEHGITKYFGIPPANTNVILLGSGTSITQAAARVLADEGVLVGFVGGGGSPLFLASQNEYRPTEYLQKWCAFWFDDRKRLQAAKLLLTARAHFLVRSAELYAGMGPDVKEFKSLANRFLSVIGGAASASELLGHEANFAKELYATWARHYGFKDFRREPGKGLKSNDPNSFLDHGNYLAYGLAATTLWVLGISHALPLLHGKTRRGALVFDLADIIKDGTIMPVAFQSASQKLPDKTMRVRCIEMLDRTKALPEMFRVVQSIVETVP